MIEKILKVWLMVVFFTVTLSSLACAEIVDRIVAFVNDEVITLSEFNNTFEPYRRRIEESYKGTDKDKVIAQTRATFLKRMIDNNLIDQEAKKAGIVVKDEELMETIKGILGSRNINIEDFTKTLTKEGSSFDDYKKEIRGQMTRMRFIRRELMPKIIITDAEIGDYYSKHRQDYEGKEAVRIRQIFIPFSNENDPETKAKLKVDAEMIRSHIDSVESFESVAAAHPAELVSDTGFVERGLMLPAVEKVAFTLEKDKISNVIESPTGFHIIRIVDKRGEGIKSLESVREEIKNKIADEKMNASYEEWMEILQKKSHIEIKL
ncbi:MAG: SurA N-terminal domain-containing protein [Syntrophales bacterium]